MSVPLPAEVGDMRLPELVQQNVGGLHIAVQDPALVGMVDGPADRFHQAGVSREIAVRTANSLGEATAGVVLHAEVR